MPIVDWRQRFPRIALQWTTPKAKVEVPFFGLTIILPNAGLTEFEEWQSCPMWDELSHADLEAAKEQLKGRREESHKMDSESVESEQAVVVFGRRWVEIPVYRCDLDRPGVGDFRSLRRPIRLRI